MIYDMQACGVWCVLMCKHSIGLTYVTSYLRTYSYGLSSERECENVSGHKHAASHGLSLVPLKLVFTPHLNTASTYTIPPWVKPKGLLMNSKKCSSFPESTECRWLATAPCTVIPLLLAYACLCQQCSLCSRMLFFSRSAWGEKRLKICINMC